MPLFHLPLLGGLALLGVPVVLHLLLRQKPKPMRFPAFRFLQQRARTSRRKLRLRHLLLLLLRMLLLALLCLALASLRGGESGGSIVLVVDTSPSMEYVTGGRSRLDEARERALSVLDRISPDSRVAIVDTATASASWGSVREARDRLAELSTQPGSVPVTTALATAFRLFAELETDATTPTTATRRLFVFSDRTPHSWQDDRLADLKAQRDRHSENAVSAVYFDVGVRSPTDLAITEIEASPTPIREGQEVRIRVTVRAVGQDAETEVFCKVVGDSRIERRPVTLRAGESTVIEFLGRSFPSGFHQVEVWLATTDALPPSDRRFATFEVRAPRRVLVLSDQPRWARAWSLALEVHGRYEPQLRQPSEVMTAEELKPFAAVVLLSVSRPAEIWPKLMDYVQQGGHLLVAPGRSETQVEEYQNPVASALLPGKLVQVVTRPDADPARWEPLNRRHPLLAKFATWREREDIGFLRYPRSARRYWQVAPKAAENVIVAYAGPERHPALLERIADRPSGSGRVVLLTTPVDFRPEVGIDEQWNDYASTAVNDGFYVVLANELLAYLTGDSEEAAWNFFSGLPVLLRLTPDARFPEYTLDAPGITGSQTRLVLGENEPELTIATTQFVGNARVSAARGAWRTAFSLNIPAAEFDLTAIPVEKIEDLLGKDSVVSTGEESAVRDTLDAKLGESVDWFPWLMLAMCVVLVGESIVSNRFYRAEAPIAGDK